MHIGVPDMFILRTLRYRSRPMGLPGAIARRLLDQVKAWAASEGATILSLGVREGNQQALMAYLSMGMRLSGERMREAGRPTNVIVVMECDLGPT